MRLPNITHFAGIIPFHGFAMFCAPFCYIYDDPIQLYFTFRYVLFSALVGLGLESRSLKSQEHEFHFLGPFTFSSAQSFMRSPRIRRESSLFAPYSRIWWEMITYHYFCFVFKHHCVLFMCFFLLSREVNWDIFLYKQCTILGLGVAEWIERPLLML